jgi:hypothetical protein
MSVDGPWKAKSLITSYLEWDLPQRLNEYRNKWQLDDERLPDPARYLTYEPVGLDAWPTIITVQMSTSSIMREDYTSDGWDPIYRCVYQMRTFVWTRDIEPGGVTESRDRLTAVVRAALLDRPAMTIGPPTSQSLDISLDEGTLREEYSDVTEVKGNRFIAGAYLAYEFGLVEPVTRRTIGEVSSFELDISRLQ